MPQIFKSRNKIQSIFISKVPKYQKAQTFKIVFLFWKMPKAESGMSDFFSIKRYLTSLNTATSYFKNIENYCIL